MKGQKQVKSLIDQDTVLMTLPCLIDKTISIIDPFLWKSIVHITRTGSERRQDISPENNKPADKAEMFVLPMCNYYFFFLTIKVLLYPYTCS